jgi:2-C-methyl-D-erythritol 2,4-cyclodiphosphate synthase
MHFPDTDDRWRGADSLALLRHVTAMLAEDGWRASNVDCAVVCELPKIAPYRDEMQRNLTAAVGAPVTVKGNRAEQLGAIGRAEGVVCFATALIHRASGTVAT